MKNALMIWVALTVGAAGQGMARSDTAGATEPLPAAVPADTMVTAAGMPERWEYRSDHEMEMPADDRWWRGFDDPVLDSLIYLGETNNLDLRQTLRRIEMARYSIKETKSGYYPQLSASAGWERARTSGLTTRGGSVAMTTGGFNIGVDMSWEIDVFGRIRQRVKEGEATLRATRAEYAATSVSVCAEIATYYMQLRTLQQELAVTREHIVQQEKVLKITEARYETGLASMLDVAQAKTVYYSTVASTSTIETQIVTTINAIAVLAGCFPQEMMRLLEEPRPQPQATMAVGVGIPADLLRRRPDVVEAEYTLASYAAALGVAKKDFLPTLELTASAGTQAWKIGDMFGKESLTYSIAPTLSWTIFDGLARNAEVASAREQMMAGIENYNLTVLTAVQEVDNALFTYSQSLRYEKEIATVLENARLAYELALDRYKQGLDAFINVSDAQMTVLEYANELVAARGSALGALISLYKSLGGSF